MSRLRVSAGSAIVALAVGWAGMGCGADSLAPAESASVTAAVASPTVTVSTEAPASPEPVAPDAAPEATPEAGPDIEYGDRFPEVLAATAELVGDDRWLVSVTLSSPYDHAARYADAWRLLDADDRELGVRVLAHDHANEQPFTRSQQIEIPPGLTTVYVEGRDQANGWSGQRFVLNLNR